MDSTAQVPKGSVRLQKMGSQRNFTTVTHKLHCQIIAFLVHDQLKYNSCQTIGQSATSVVLKGPPYPYSLSLSSNLSKSNVEQKRRQGELTLPSTLRIERATNLFLQASSATELAQLRQHKDDWRG